MSESLLITLISGVIIIIIFGIIMLNSTKDFKKGEKFDDIDLQFYLIGYSMLVCFIIVIIGVLK